MPTARSIGVRLARFWRRSRQGRPFRATGLCREDLLHLTDQIFNGVDF
jgi:hypothetical protein